MTQPHCKRRKIETAPSSFGLLPGVNILIYAFRKDTARHAVCKRWLDSVVSGDAQFGVSPLVLSAVARITTNPRIFKQPAPLDKAFAYCNSLLSQPHCEIVRPGERHWSIFTRLCIETSTTGRRCLVCRPRHRAWCTWITYDRDYARFPGLDRQQPAG